MTFSASEVLLYDYPLLIERRNAATLRQEALRGVAL